MPNSTIAFYDKLGSFSAPLVEAFRAAGATVLGPYERFEQSQAADIWYTDWADENLARMAFTKPPGVRLVAHMDSYEAFGDLSTVNWPNVDLLICHSEYVHEIAVKHAHVPACVPWVVQKRGVDLDKWTFKADRDAKRITWAGLMSWKKGPQVLVQAAQHLQQYDYEIYVAGECQDVRSGLCLQHAVDTWGLTNLHFCGWQADMNAWLDEINPAFHLCTSLFESGPYNVLEAAAKGIQPLVWDYPGASEYFPKEWLWRVPSDLMHDDLEASIDFQNHVIDGLLNTHPEIFAEKCRDYVKEHQNSAVLLPQFVEHVLAPQEALVCA